MWKDKSLLCGLGVLIPTALSTPCVPVEQIILSALAKAKVTLLLSQGVCVCVYISWYKHTSWSLQYQSGSEHLTSFRFAEWK